ncbi:MAG: proton-conducting transporter membrane subunit, partial [Chitinophagaceae bacterium]
MTSLLNLFLLLPLCGLILSFLISREKELMISRVAFYTAGLTLLSVIAYSIAWLNIGHVSVNLKEVAIYTSKNYEFAVDLYFDKITMVYLTVGAFLTFLITIYSRYYLHRESGYKRFFNTILFFFLGYNLTVLSGNFETLFIGWEILGISSFLLIAFYRDRYLPVRNAVKVFSVYRIGDVGILLAMWASHHLWHENITFAKLYNFELVHEHLSGHTLVGVFISLMILIAALAKSAQLPFSSWLARAMEGPTTSSAIFYGSLSVHFGVFLLLRTMPFWEQQTSVRILIGVIGVSTAIVTTLIARVQSSMKSQIAYASIAQIGIIFLEVALGFDTLALIHFAGNAGLRTYQLLVSPSAVSYLIREQFYNYQPRQQDAEDSIPRRLEYTLYWLSVKEFFLDRLMNRLIFDPLKKAGRKLNFINIRNLFYYFIPAYLLGILLFFKEDQIPEIIHSNLPIVFALIGLLMVLRSFTERKSPILAWLLIILNHFWMALAISFNEHFEWDHTAWYLSGIVICGGLGLILLRKLRQDENSFFDLNTYYGHVYEYPG